MPSKEALEIAEQWTRDNALTMTPAVDKLARSIDELRVKDLERVEQIMDNWDNWRWAMEQNGGEYLDKGDCMVRASAEITALRTAMGEQKEQQK